MCVCIPGLRVEFDYLQTPSGSRGPSEQSSKTWSESWALALQVPESRQNLGDLEARTLDGPSTKTESSALKTQGPYIVDRADVSHNSKSAAQLLMEQAMQLGPLDIHAARPNLTDRIVGCWQPWTLACRALQPGLTGFK